MAQAMLPFPETPTDRAEPVRRRRGPNGIARRPPKFVDQRLTAALADPQRVVFLDVETTGLSWFYDELTIVGWLCDGEYHLHVAGDDPASLVQSLKCAHALVTFNGTLF